MYLHNEIIHNKVSASIILPNVFKLIKPNSILDIGCGIGTWLSVAKDLGVQEVLGVDGENVSPNLLAKYLEKNEFYPYNLSLPLDLGRKFDLCLCLEVAEHLPQEAAEALVGTLVCHSDVILFSAAIPGQGGQNHLNEQWPEYWEKLFNHFNFVFFDIIRPLIWENNSVDFWYKQNLFLVVRKDSYFNFPEAFSSLSKIHPDLLKSKNCQIERLEKRIISLTDGRVSWKIYFEIVKKKFKRFFLR
ncbi:class I SAM-dependent methyltransferase [Algoriphagus confluentis]|uniref:Methyltransferase domain-containing protein n=1 Tax=Algoriphagus confluentis TaxID=1697556 RepID=A0ABQ6PNR3_9BACT|nr:hypothetical protein Aconfl_22100 [Algoriphagus confluentis]